MRRAFYVVGGVPGGWVAGQVGVVLGTFIASGAMHEAAMWLMGRGMDWTVVAFFGGQGALVLIERAWRRATGRRVKGTWGRAWTYANVMLWAQFCGKFRFMS